MTIATGPRSRTALHRDASRIAVASVVERAQHTGRIVEVRLALGFRAEIRPYRGRDTELWSLPASLCRGHGAAKAAEPSQRDAQARLPNCLPTGPRPCSRTPTSPDRPLGAHSALRGPTVDGMEAVGRRCRPCWCRGPPRAVVVRICAVTASPYRVRHVLCRATRRSGLPLSAVARRDRMPATSGAHPPWRSHCAEGGGAGSAR
jgi:hypothetical protein